MTGLRELRITAGLTQAEVASRMGVSQPLVAQWETGRKDPSVAHLALLSQVLAGNGATDDPPAVSGPVGARKSYPAAPSDAKARRAWMDARNAAIRTGGREMYNPSGTEGKGIPRPEKKKKKSRD